MEIHSNLSKEERKEIADGLSHLLADTYILYVKTHNFHWNVTGPMFTTLHTLFEQQYTELALAVDLIAERIRALGYPAPGSYHQFSSLSTIAEETGVPSAQDMVRQLVYGQEAVVMTAKKAFLSVDKANDQATADILTTRIQQHEKNAWMLRALLE